MNKFSIALLAAVTLALVSIGAEAKVDIFACEPEWAALSQELGGDKVSIYQATTALQDVHHIQARPSLLARVRSADLLVCSGADLEVGWLPVLMQSGGNPKIRIGQPGYFMASDFVQKLEVPSSVDRSMGDIHPYGNPHVHSDPRNIVLVAKALSERLAQIDGADAAYFQARTRDFLERWDKAMARWQSAAAPLKGMKLVAHHKDEEYLIHWLGLDEVGNLEPKPGVPPTAAHLADLLAQMKSAPADVITRSAYNDPKAAEWLGEHTKIPVVTLPYTVGGTPEAKDLFSFFDDTINRLLKVRKPA
ncbi:MAG: zinc ABC transporter substrate-binding protein [Proteobacteria bacterium]|nr:MAG: zinc ABC transporter substrate-binding protein [Pseudomonadota bacterium]